jgi:hypothetical protein
MIFLFSIGKLSLPKSLKRSVGTYLSQMVKREGRGDDDDGEGDEESGEEPKDRVHRVLRRLPIRRTTEKLFELLFKKAYVLDLEENISLWTK